MNNNDTELNIVDAKSLYFELAGIEADIRYGGIEAFDKVCLNTLQRVMDALWVAPEVVKQQDLQSRGEPVAWLVSGPYQKQAFTMRSSAEAWCRGLNKGFEEVAYSVSELYPSPQPAESVKEPSDEVKEIVSLVDTLIASVNGAHHANRDDWRDACFQSADQTYETIKAKLIASYGNSIKEKI